MMMSNDTLTVETMADSQYSYRPENVMTLLKNHLDTFHSDYRWSIKIYKVKDRNNNYRDFANTKMDFLGVEDKYGNYWNILVYGAEAHQFYKGKWNLEPYH